LPAWPTCPQTTLPHSRSHYFFHLCKCLELLHLPNGRTIKHRSSRTLNTSNIDHIEHRTHQTSITSNIDRTELDRPTVRPLPYDRPTNGRIKSKLRNVKIRLRQDANWTLLDPFKSRANDQLQQTTPTVPQACRANQTRGRVLKEPDTRQQARHEAGPGARHKACARWTITKTVWKDLALLRLSWILDGQSLNDIRLRDHRHQSRTTTV